MTPTQRRSYAYPQEEDAANHRDPGIDGDPRCHSLERSGVRGRVIRGGRADFAVRGTVAGGIKIIQPGEALTFVFSETNKGPGSAPEDLVITKVTNAKVVGNPPCVLPNGTAINSDTPSCEPGLVKAGQSASIVITTRVTGGSGMAASVRLCLENENTAATRIRTNKLFQC